MKKIDQITAIVLLMFGGYIIWESLKMPIQAQYGPGRGFFPLGLGIILAVLALSLLIQAMRRSPEEDEQSPFPAASGMLAVVLVIVGLIVYAMLMERIGYILTTLIFVAYLMGIVQRDKLPTTIITSVAITFLMYLIFDFGLGFRLPKGPLGF